MQLTYGNASWDVHGKEKSRSDLSSFICTVTLAFFQVSHSNT